MKLRGRWLLVVLALAAGLSLAAWGSLRADRGGGASQRPLLLLFTTLPIFWGEATDLSEMLRDGQTPWPRRSLERRQALVPIDALDAGALNRGGRLVMAQPRPLAPAENVALDEWVARGGRLLLFADPMLTAESAFAIGDRRRPQDIVLLSPILARWGLRLEFDEDQPPGERTVDLGDAIGLPVALPGRFATVAPGRADAACQIERNGLIARCRVGRGGVLAVADAALFDAALDANGEARRARVLEKLEALAFD